MLRYLIKKKHEFKCILDHSEDNGQIQTCAHNINIWQSTIIDISDLNTDDSTFSGHRRN